MKKIINILNKLLFVFYKKKNNLNKLKKVLVVSNTALGDTILSTPVIKTLRKNYPDIYITFMVNKKVYPLFKDYEPVNKTIIYSKSFIGLLKHILYIKKEKFDSIFFLHSNGPQDLFIALASQVDNIHKAINYPSKISKPFSSIIKNKTHPYRMQHIIEHRLDTIRYLNLLNVNKNIDLPKRFYHKPKKQSSELIIGLQLGAADTYKIWPVENFISLSKKLLNKYPNVKIFLLGINSEKVLAKKLQLGLSNNKRVLDYCGKTSIKELPELINSLDLLITNDTGTLHVAIALKKNTISLFSPTDSKIFGPYQDLNIHSIIQQNGDFINNKPKKQRSQEAMSLIKVEEVYSATIKQINRIKSCVE